MRKQKKYLPLMLAFAAMMSLLFVACSKEDDPEIIDEGPISGVSEPDVMYGIMNDDGGVTYTASINPIQVNQEGETVSLPIVMYKKGGLCSLNTPFPIYKDLLEKYPLMLYEWKRIYADAKIFKIFSGETYELCKELEVEQKSDNIWQAEGFKVKRIWNGDRYTLEVTVPENNTGKNRIYSFGWGARDENDKRSFSSFSTFNIIQESMR